ncbi:PAQR family membrane homeostasis protein TrhA [Roseovarius salinarum]|uniref:PAQR family membrane homeostasis protein TrhA n=1 Tax=Roseovarius salinarum TaxID=1981892 RepID=UPI000C3472E7|nr:hemolysin III family protein [Roseovarius salinarum]
MSTALEQARDPAYPAYSRAERIADAVVHVSGVVAAIVGVSLLFALWAWRMDGATLTAAIVYSGTLVVMLSASAAYHLGAHTRLRPILRRLDHAAIYVKIAGTFTPLAAMLGSLFGYVLLGVIWALALVGAAMKILTKPGRMTDGWAPYLALGWAGVALFVPLTGVLPGASLWLILAGGLAYTAGIVFYRWERLRFSLAIWHGFVLGGTACFFVGITMAAASV